MLPAQVWHHGCISIWSRRISQQEQAGKWPEEVNIMTYPDGTILKGSSRELYVIEGGYRRSIACCITFDSKGYDWNNIVFIFDQNLNAIPLGVPVTSDETAPKCEEADRLIRSRF